MLKIDIEKTINDHLSKKLLVKYKVKIMSLDESTCRIKAFPSEFIGKEKIRERYRRLACEERTIGVLDPLVKCLQDNIINVLKNTTCKCDESTFTDFQLYLNLSCTLLFDVKYTNNDSMILFQLDL